MRSDFIISIAIMATFTAGTACQPADTAQTVDGLDTPQTAEAWVFMTEDGAEVNIKDNHGQTPMVGAAGNFHVHATAWRNTMTWLTGQGVDVNGKDNDGRTPMFRAAESGHVKAMVWLKEQGADVNAKDNHGRTPLSVVGDKKEAKEWLLANGAHE